MAVVLLLLILFPIVCGSSVFVLFCYALFCVYSIFAIFLMRKRKLDVLQLLSYRCIATINILWLFLAVPWVGLQCAIVAFPDHTHLIFELMFVFYCRFDALLIKDKRYTVKSV